MIQLKVEEYCHGCSEFEPDVQKVAFPYHDVGYVYDFNVRCEHREKCAALKRYLEKGPK